MTSPTVRSDRPAYIRNAMIIDGAGGPPAHNMTIRIIDDRIDALDRDDAFAISEDEQVIDASGKVVIPGLIDAHVHLTHEPDALAPLYPRFGVTTVRDTGGNLDALVELRSRLEERSLAGPRIYFCGPIFDTPPLIHPAISAPVHTVEDARGTMAQVAESGAIAAKLYVSVQPSLVRDIIQCARDFGLPSIGDLGSTSSAQAIDAGISGIEHASTAYLDLVPTEHQAPISLFFSDGPAVWRREWNRGFASAIGDGERGQQLGRKMAESGTFYDPTLVVLESLGHLDDPAITASPDVALMPEAFRTAWQSRVDGRREHWSPEDFDIARKAFHTMVEFTAAAHSQGATLLVGTDAPNPYVVPGASMHREMEHLVGIGMSAMDVITAATSGNAKAIGIEQERGTLAPAMRADLIILEANPLDDIRHSRRISTVFQDGQIVRQNESWGNDG